MQPSLSILVPSYRTTFLDQKLLQLVRSPRYINQVEFLMLNDNDWNSTGEKHRRLFEMSRGKYVMGMGDDDLLIPSALSQILDHADGRWESFCFNVAVTMSNGQHVICRMRPSKFVDKPGELEWWPDSQVEIQYRPWHPIMPTLRRYYEGIEWTNSSFGEDNDIIEQIAPKIITAWRTGRVAEADLALYHAFPEVGKVTPKTKPRYCND